MSPYRRTTSRESAAAYRSARRERGATAPRIRLDMARATVEELRRALQDRVTLGKARALTWLAMRMVEDALGGGA